MQYLGDFPEDATVYIPFNTFTSDDPQASATITNLADADIKVHKDGSATQIVTDGATVAIDFDTITGNHLITIDTSASADYAVGSDYAVRIEGTTVDAGTINAWVGSFSIENRWNEVKVVTWNGVALATTNPLPNAAADAAGGLPISDAGGLDLDAKVGALTYTVANEVDCNVITKTGFSLAATGLDAISSTATGMVEAAKAVWDRVLTGATHNVTNSAGRRLRGIQEFQGYEDGAIWIDTVNGTAGTTSYENGTVENAVDTIANANTLNTALTLNRFHLFPASSITLAATQSNQVFLGTEWTLALGGQNIAGTDFEGANVSGTSTGANPHFQHCSIGNTTTAPGRFGWCGFSGTLTVGSAGNYFMHDCYSEVAGASSPTIDMGAAVGATNLSVRRWSGGLTLNNLASGDVVSLDGTFGTITLNGADAQVEIRGIAKAVVNNLTGSPTVNDDSVKADDVASILADTNELQGDDVPGLIAALDTVVDRVEADTQNIQGRLPAALVGGLMSSDVTAVSTSTTAADNLEASALGVVPGACEGTPSTTVVQTNLAEATDDHYIGRIIVFTSGDAAGEASDITDYTGATGTVTITAITTAPAATDTFVIV